MNRKVTVAVKLLITKHSICTVRLRIIYFILLYNIFLLLLCRVLYINILIGPGLDSFGYTTAYLRQTLLWVSSWSTSSSDVVFASPDGPQTVPPTS